MNIKMGDITKETVDVIVNSNNQNLNLNSGKSVLLILFLLVFLGGGGCFVHLIISFFSETSLSSCVNLQV